MRQVLTFAEAHGRALLVPRTTTVAEAIHKLSHSGPDGPPATALIVTDRAAKSDRPLRVIAAFDLPKLTAALKII